jgi:hypothetical protein
VLKAPGTMRLKLRCDGPLSNFALSFNLRCYTKDAATDGIDHDKLALYKSLADEYEVNGAMVGRCTLTLG